MVTKFFYKKKNKKKDILASFRKKNWTQWDFVKKIEKLFFWTLLDYRYSRGCLDPDRKKLLNNILMKKKFIK